MRNISQKSKINNNIQYNNGIILLRGLQDLLFNPNPTSDISMTVSLLKSNLFSCTVRLSYLSQRGTVGQVGQDIIPIGVVGEGFGSGFGSRRASLFLHLLWY